MAEVECHVIMHAFGEWVWQDCRGWGVLVGGVWKNRRYRSWSFKSVL